MVQPSFVDSRGVSIRVFSGNTVTNDLNVTNDFTLGSAFYFCAPDIAEEVDFDGGLNMVINSLETRLIPLPFESFNTEVIYPIPQEYQNLGLPLRFAFSMSEVINFEVWLLLPIDPCVTENNENQDILEFIISLVATGVTGAAQVLIPNPLGALLATTLIRGVTTRILSRTNNRRSFRVFNPEENPEVTIDLNGTDSYSLPPGQTYSNDEWDGLVFALPAATNELEIPIQVYEYIDAP